MALPSCKVPALISGRSQVGIDAVEREHAAAKAGQAPCPLRPEPKATVLAVGIDREQQALWPWERCRTTRPACPTILQRAALKMIERYWPRPRARPRREVEMPPESSCRRYRCSCRKELSPSPS